jgi:carbon starvation protein
MFWPRRAAIFCAGAHDSGALFASIRHKARSITQVVREHMSPAAYFTFLIFVWVSLVYVIIAFADVTAGSFAKFQRFDMVLDGKPTTLDINGGAVVIGAAAYLLFSVVLGLGLRFTKAPWWAGLIGAVVALSLVIWQAPNMASWLANHGWDFMHTEGKDAGLLTKRWDQALLVYCFLASIVPMWLLLQPRGIIGATFLYATLFFGIVGALAGGWSAGSLSVNWDLAWRGYFSPIDGSMLFPFLFITIACGACSGFHAIVASGTTCKQLQTERDVRPVGYGAMLLEALVAIFALSTVMVLTSVPNKVPNPDAVYARGIGNFMNLIGIQMAFAVGFGLLAFSSFVFDTLDVCTRLGRYVMQELLGVGGLTGGVIATFITLAAPSVYLWQMPAGSFKTFWTIFGTSNQLLAALTLVGVSVWLWRTGRPVWFALVPAMFMVATTGTALVFNFRNFILEWKATHLPPAMINMSIAALLFALGALVVVEAVRVLKNSRRERLGFPVLAGKA